MACVLPGVGVEVAKSTGEKQVVARVRESGPPWLLGCVLLVSSTAWVVAQTSPQKASVLNESSSV